MEYLTVGFAQQTQASDYFAQLGELPENCFRGLATMFGGVIDSWVPTMIHKGAFTKTLQEAGRGVKILWQHDVEELIGKPEYLAECDQGLCLQGKISLTQRGQDALILMRDGVLDALSIGFDPIKEDLEYGPKGDVLMRHIREVRLWEISPVTWGADPNGKISEVHGKAMPVIGHIEQLGATSFGNLPLYDRKTPWDASAAEKAVREWAGATDAPNAKYRRAFFWYDAAAADQFGSYKLGFATVTDGRLTAVPRGIFAVAAVLQGSRGGVNIPDADKTAVKAVVEKYYAKMRSEFDDDTIVVPWSSESQSALGHYEETDRLFLLGQLLTQELLSLEEVRAIFEEWSVAVPRETAHTTDGGIENMILDAELVLSTMGFHE